MDQEKNNAGNASIKTGKKKRKFRQIRDSILFQLSFGRKTVNQIAEEINANWKTVDLHLIYLKGRGMIVEVYKSKYVRIYELSEEGKKYVALVNPSLAKVVETEEELQEAKEAVEDEEYEGKADYVG